MDPATPPAAPSPEAGVSVVIPAFNYAQYLELAVSSALAQHHAPLEILIIDDGSTDGTLELGRRLAEESPRVRYLRQENAGLSAARNTGIRGASHPFIAFLDADDEWLPEMLQAIMGEFARQPPATLITACNSYRIDPSGAPTGEKQTRPRGDRFFTAADIILKTRFMPSSTVVRTVRVRCRGPFRY